MDSDLPPLLKFCHAVLNKDNKDAPLPLANTLSVLFPDRPPREKYIKYDDPLLTDDQIDADKKRKEVVATKTQGKTLFVEIWRRLSEKFLSDWRNVEFAFIDSLEESFDWKFGLAFERDDLTTQNNVTLFDCNELINVTRTHKVLLTSDQQVQVMKEQTRLWKFFDPAHKNPDNLVKRTAIRVSPKLFDVIVGLQLPDSHTSEWMNLSVYIASYHAFDIKVNKISPSLFVQGRYPLRNPYYHEIFIVGLPKDAKLQMYGMTLEECDREMRSCMLQQHILYELDNQHQLADSGGMAFKVAHRDAEEGQLVTDISN